ncbi:MAG: hypothetical protein WA946_10870, partial [Nitrospirota bacterium]
ENTNPQVALLGLDSPNMNRRIRNRTYGGVGGRRGRPRLLPDQRLKLAAKERKGRKEKAGNHNFSFKFFSAFLRSFAPIRF